MALTFNEVESIPGHNYNGGPRNSPCRDAVESAEQNETGVVMIEGTSDEVTRFYKTMIQFRSRHRDILHFGLRKSGNVVYVWVEKSGYPIPVIRERAAGGEPEVSPWPSALDVLPDSSSSAPRRPAHVRVAATRNLCAFDPPLARQTRAQHGTCAAGLVDRGASTAQILPATRRRIQLPLGA